MSPNGAPAAQAAVSTTRDGAVALVTLTRSAKANAMDGEVTDSLHRALVERFSRRVAAGPRAEQR